MVICFAAFQATRDLGDLAALFAIGMLGVLMKRFDWPRPVFLIGFVLAAGMETYLYQAVHFDGWGFLTKPGVLIIGALTVISIVCGIKFGHAPEADVGTDEREPTGRAVNLTSQTAFAAVVVAAFAYGLYDAFQQSILGGVFSGGVAAVMLVFSGIVLFKLATRRVEDPINFDNEIAAGYVDNAEVASLKEFIFWLAGFLIAAWLVGYLIAIGLFFLMFLRIKASSSWAQTLLLTTIGIGFLVTLAHLMILDFPRGLLQDAVELPWPIG